MTDSFESIVEEVDIHPFCESENHEKPVRAIVLLASRCCDDSRYLCATCGMIVRQGIEELEGIPNSWWRCTQCETVVVQPTFSGVAVQRSLL